MKPPTPTEHQEAMILVEWMRLRDIFFIHVPNEGYRSPVAGRRLKSEGMTRGCPDYIILSRPGASRAVKTYPTLGMTVPEYDFIDPPVFLELKRVGGRLSPHQEQFLEALQAEGYATIVAYGADEAIAELIKIGY